MNVKKYWLGFFILLLVPIYVYLFNSESDVVLVEAGDEWVAPKVMLDDVYARIGVTPKVVSIGNQPAYLYVNEKGQLIFKYNGKSRILEEKQVSTNIWLERKNNNVYVFWWVKNGPAGKTLYFKGSDDLGETFGQKVKINTGAGVLASVSVAVKDKHIAVAYMDERKPAYKVYVNVSHDGGRTWEKEDFRLDKDITILNKDKSKHISAGSFAVDPKITFLENGNLYVVWQQRVLSDDNKVLVQFVTRVSSDSGKTWGNETLIYEEKTTSPFEYISISDGNNLYVFVADSKKGVLGLKLVEGGKWLNIGYALGTENPSTISYMKAALNNEMVKVSYLIKSGEAEGKYFVEVASHFHKSKTWEGSSFRLDRGKEMLEPTKALYQDIAVLKNGEFVVVWEDYRSLVSSLYMDYTINKGKSWQLSPFPVTRGGYSETRFPSLLVDADGGLRLLSASYVINDMSSHPRYVSQYFPFAESGMLSGVSAPRPLLLSTKNDAEKLKENASKLMKARIDSEWELEWELLDPIYKRSNNKEEWLRSRGKIKFQKMSIVDVSVDGNVGHVQVSIEYVLPAQVLQGQQMDKSDVKKTQAKLKWVKFYGKWYFSPGSFIRKHLDY